MIQEAARQLIEQLIDVEFTERRERLAKDVLRIQAEFASRNALQSSQYVEAVCQRCEDDIRGRSQVIWIEVTKVLGRRGFAQSAAFAEDLKAEIERYLPRGLPDLTDRMEQTIRLISAPGTPGFADLKRSIEERLERVRQLVLKKLGGEIDLLALARGPEAAASGATVYIHGTVGTVQTGPYATSTVNIGLTAEDRDAIRRALDLTIETIQRAPTLIAGGPQIVEIAEDARVELEKSAPNTLKLSTCLQGIATTVQTVGSLAGVYEAVKLALLPFGILLP